MKRQQEDTLKAAVEMAQGHLDRIQEILAEDAKHMIPFTEQKMRNLTRIEKNNCDALISIYACSGYYGDTSLPIVSR